MGKIKLDNFDTLNNPGLPDNEYMRLLHEICYDYVKDIVGFSTNNHQDASDITQEAFIQALLNPERVRAHPKPHRWLVTTARNIAGKRFRQDQQRHTAESKASERRLAETEHSRAENEIRRLLKKLKPDDERLILAYYFEEASTEQIAQALGLDEASVLRRLSRAREKFKKILEKTKIITFFVLFCLVLTLFRYLYIGGHFNA